jgi:hypothetical protein
MIGQLYFWTDWVLFYGLLILRLWALVDCVTRKAAAFPAVNKLTKPAWLAMLLLGLLLSSPWVQAAPLGIFSLVSTVISLVYLVDVRPAVREISRGTR